MSNGLENHRTYNVAFFGKNLLGWTGGANYLRNLLIAINTLENKRINAYLLVGTSVEKKELLPFKSYATIIRSSIFDNRDYRFVFLSKKILKLKEILVWRKLVSLKIDVVSHSLMYGKAYPFRTLNWIPDFQHLHFPELFEKHELESRNRMFESLIKESDSIVFSSEDAVKDARLFLPECDSKYSVLRFVSIPEENIVQNLTEGIARIREKYKFGNKFFYLPNQFWKHKNHKVVFEAVNILKQQGIDITVVCTGKVDDYRGNEHILKLQKYIADNNLQKNIYILGMIPYPEVFILMRTALAIINPSLFEGWSSTVEEAKSISQQLILSDIGVHKEQNPLYGLFFSPHNADELALLLKKSWQVKWQTTTNSLDTSNKILDARIQEFGKSYFEIIDHLLNPI